MTVQGVTRLTVGCAVCCVAMPRALCPPVLVMIDDRRHCENAVADNGNKNTRTSPRQRPRAGARRLFANTCSGRCRIGHETTDPHAILRWPCPTVRPFIGRPGRDELRSRAVGQRESGGGGASDNRYGSGARSIASRCVVP